MLLSGGAYESRSIISAAQRCLNLYLEKAPDSEGEPSPVAHIPTPGLVRLSVAPYERIRCLYRATTGDLYGVAGNGVYYINPSWQWNLIGTIVPTSYSDVVPRHTPVSIVDNGTNAIVADGTIDGWTFNVQTRSGWTGIPTAGYPATDGFGNPYTTGWYGSIRVDYLDTFFLAAKPSSPIWYVSGSEATTFDALDFASHSAFGDSIQVLATMKRNIWAIGKYSTEIWYNSGGGGSSSLSNNTFPFDLLPTYHDVGICAPYSLVRVSDQLFWLSQDGAGNGVFIKAAGYEISRISTHAIEKELGTYSDLTDCVGYTYQQGGHVFLVWNFTTADRTWCYDVMTGQFHERCWIDPNDGIEHRHRVNQCAFAYNTVVGGDWETGDLYKFDPAVYTDAIPGSIGTGPIKRLRSFPHIIDTQMNRRVFYKRVIANMTVGTSSNVAPEEPIINTTFTASDGTLIDGYSNDLDLHGRFTSIGSGEAEVISDQFVAVESGTSPAYQANTSPTSPNYTVKFTAIPSDFTAASPDGSDVWVMGRATDQDHGYRAGISSDGTDYSVFLSVQGGDTSQSVDFGPYTDFSSGDTFTVYMDIIGTNITVSLSLPHTGEWIDSSGARVGSRTSAIAITDATYSAPGSVIVGGDWIAS